MISDIKENRNQETQMTEDKSSSLPCKFDFDKKKGWIQTTKSGNRVYANKHMGHGKVIGGANEFARANVRKMRSPENFPENPQGVSDTILYHCLRHDYVYYPQDFVDTNGVQRKRGYYDEACEYHENIKILYYPQSSGAACGYCGHNNIFDVSAQNMDDFWCSQCGAAVDYMATLDAEYDFLIYSHVFEYAKEFSPIREEIPKEKEVIQYTNTINAYVGDTKPLRYIPTRPLVARPIKEWKPNTDLIIESNTMPAEEERTSDSKFDMFTFAHLEKDEREQRVPQEEPLKPLNFDQELQYIQTREYNPAPVKEQTYEPHKYQKFYSSRSKKTNSTSLGEVVAETVTEVVTDAVFEGVCDVFDLIDLIF